MHVRAVRPDPFLNQPLDAEITAKCGAIQAAIRTAVPRMVCQTSLAWEFARNRNRAASRPTGLSREHAGAGLVSDGITDDQSALIAARWCLLVSVLEDTATFARNAL